MSAHPGLSGSDPDVLGRVVLKLLKFAEDKVPSSEWKGTKVQLMITAEEDGVGRALEECRKVLRSSGFLFRDDWASVLKGQDEGLYSWLAVNYALGYIGNKPQETAGVIVLGKSAMRVSFANSEPAVSNFTRAIRLAGVSYHLYAQSMQQFGQDVIWKLLHEQGSQDLRSFSENNERTVSNPCIPRGYELTLHASDGKLVKSHGAGNFSACKSELMNLLNGRQGRCVHPPCELTTSILNELERKPYPRQRFFLTSELQGLVPKASVSAMEEVGQRFCGDDWETLKGQYHIDSRDLSRSCFSHAFAAAVLDNSFGIPLDDKRVEFAVGSTQIDWRLGAFLFQSIVEPLDNLVEDLDTQIVRNESITYLLLFAVALVFILLVAFFVMKLRKPQYKTIYDLERGHYIVTRVPR